MKTRIRPLLLNSGLLLASLAAATGLAEIVLRLFRPQPLEAAYVFPDGTLRHRPSFSYRYTRQGFSNAVTFNALGLRGAEVPATKRAGVPRILFMGDSFVEGKQVSDGEVLTVVLSRLLEESGRPAEVINAGVAGAGTGEELILWERLGRSLDPDLVILGFYPNDVRNNVGRRFFALRGGEVVQVREPRLPRARWIYDARKYLAAHSHLYMIVQSAREAWRERKEEGARAADGEPGEGTAQRLLETEEVFEVDPAPEIAEGWDLTEALLAEMKRRVEASGARFLLAIFPTRFQVDDSLWLAHARDAGIDPGLYDLEIPGRRLAAWAERTGAHVVDLLAAFREANRSNSFYHAIDAHWNPDGHRLAAEIIEGALLAQDLP